MISLLDYGAGNVRSVVNALERLGETVHIVASTSDIDTAQRLVFPGVGSFGSMMHILREKQFIDPLLAYLDLSDVLCEVGVTDAARWAGKAIHDQTEDQVQRGRVVSVRSD